MAGKHWLTICVIAALAMTASVDSARSTDSLKGGVDFSGFSGGSVLNWLGSKGFEPKQDASNARRIGYSASPNALALETKTRAFGLLLNEMDVRDYSRVRIEWGVDAFPPGASYEKGIRAEADYGLYFLRQGATLERVTFHSQQPLFPRPLSL